MKVSYAKLTPGMYRHMTERNFSDALASLKQTDAKVHTLGMYAMWQASMDNLNPLGRLVRGLPKSIRAKGFIEWIMMFAPLKITETKDTWEIKKVFKPQENPDAPKELVKPFDLDGADANPFWTIKELAERIIKVSNQSTLKMIDKWIENCEKAQSGDPTVKFDEKMTKVQQDKMVSLLPLFREARAKLAA